MSSPAGRVLLATCDAVVFVNGRDLQPRPAVVRLADKDEIQLAGELRLFYSTETVANITPFAGIDGGPCICARCKTPIEIGSPVVVCPGCGSVAHQTEEIPCFCYPRSATCPACPHPSALDAGFTFHPEDL
jgi:hypothetical protein